MAYDGVMPGYGRFDEAALDAGRVVSCLREKAFAAYDAWTVGEANVLQEQLENGEKLPREVMLRAQTLLTQIVPLTSCY